MMCWDKDNLLWRITDHSINNSKTEANRNSIIIVRNKKNIYISVGGMKSILIIIILFSIVNQLVSVKCVLKKFK